MHESTSSSDKLYSLASLYAILVSIGVSLYTVACSDPEFLLFGARSFLHYSAGDYRADASFLDTTRHPSVLSPSSRCPTRLLSPSPSSHSATPAIPCPFSRLARLPIWNLYIAIIVLCLGLVYFLPRQDDASLHLVPRLSLFLQRPLASSPLGTPVARCFQFAAFIIGLNAVGLSPQKYVIVGHVGSHRRSPFSLL